VVSKLDASARAATDRDNYQALLWRAEFGESAPSRSSESF
jgi:hypothetical protein